MPVFSLTYGKRADKYGIFTVKDRAGNHLRDVRLSADELRRVRADRAYFQEVAGFSMDEDYFCADVQVKGETARSFRVNADDVGGWLAVKGAPPSVSRAEVKDTSWVIRSRTSARGYALDVGDFSVDEDGGLCVCYDAGVEGNYIRPAFLMFSKGEWDGNAEQPTVYEGVLAKVVFPGRVSVKSITAGQMETG